MRLHWPILAPALGIFCFFLHASDELGQRSTRERKILEIQQLIESRDIAGANRMLAEAAREFPSDAGFDNLRGVLAAQQGDYTTAESSFNQAVKREPKFTGAYLNLGRLYQEHSRADAEAGQKALRVYRQVLGYEPNNGEANYQSAVLLSEGGKYQDSIRHLARLPANIQSSTQALSILCADYAALNDRKGADDAAAGLSSNSEFSEMDVQQMLPGLQAGKRDDLIVSLLESIQKRQTLSAPGEHQLGLALERVNSLTEARAMLEKFATNGNMSVASLFELARIAHKQRDYQGALGYLAHARDLEPSNASLHYSFGSVCLDMNLVAEARNSFEKAVILEPENPTYNYAMGVASAFRRDPEEAVPYFQKYLKLKPNDPRAKLALGAALFRAKDYQSALPWLEASAAISETAPKAHYYLGAIALQEHRLDDGLRELEQSLKAAPNDPGTLAELGQYYLMRKDFRQSEEQLQHALELDRDHFSANFYLLTLYTRTGDSRRETQAKRFDQLQQLLDEKTQQILRIVEVRPFGNP